MAFSNSPLVVYTSISPNRNNGRYDNSNRANPVPITKITKITIHHMAGVCSLENFNNIVSKPSRQMSSNYAIGNDGRIGLFCEEKDRSWCSSSEWNDNRAITIEVSNSAYGDASGWPISDAAYKSLINLCVDICKRNGISKLEFTGDKNGSLTYHYFYTQTACLPIDRTELLTPTGWKMLKDIEIGDTVATVHIDNLGIKFDEVENIVPQKTQDTYVTRDFEGTSDHRVVYYNQAGRQYVGQYKDLYDKTASIYIPNAGFIENPEGFGGLSYAELAFLVAVQADGHYMKDGNCRYGIEFHLKKERKIKKLKKLFELLDYKCTVCEQSDGTTKLRLYGADFVNWCEEYLHDKCFTWEWLTMNRQQVEIFMETILQFDECEANKSYSSSIPINVDVVQAIAAINGIGTKMSKEHDRVFFKKRMRSLGDNVRHRKPRQTVSCVTVRSGFILIRQHGRTTITGNCPGPWIKAHTQEICDKVNTALGVNNSTSLGLYTISLKTGDPIYDKPNGTKTGEISASTKYTITEESSVNGYKYGKLKSGAGWVIVEKPAVASTGIKAGDTVSIKQGATYYNGQTIPAFVMNDKWIVSSVNGDRAVLGQNVSKTQNITSPINTKYLTVVSVSASGSVSVSYTKQINGSTPLYATPGGAVTGTVGTTGVYTITYESTVNGVKYGKLKSGIGWVNLNQTSSVSTSTTSTEIKKGDTVKVLDPVIYGSTKKFYNISSTYKVLEISGNRVVISADGKNVTAAIDKKYLQKV